MRGIGSFSKSGQLPIRDKNQIPTQFVRPDEPGTTLYIPAYKDSENWKESTIRAALKNFWLAIINKKLEIEILDEESNAVIIDSHSLGGLIEHFYKKNGVGAAWKKDSPLPYYMAYTSAKKVEKNLPRLSAVECYLNPGKSENSPNYIACFRKNMMLIQHIRFKSIIPYAGVFICSSDEGNKILQKMEPPQHDSWDPNVLHAKDDQGKPLAECLEADKEYKKFLSEEIHKMLGSQTSKKIALTSLDGRISINHGDSGNDQVDTTRTNSAEGKHKSDKATIQRSTFTQEASRLEVRSANVATAGKVTSKKAKTKKPKTKQTKKSDPNVVGEINATLRSITVRDLNGWITTLIIRSTPNTKLKIKLKAGTENSTESVTVKSASLGVVQDMDGTNTGDLNCISGITTDGDGIAKLNVRFEEDRKYALTAEFYETR